MFCTLVRPCTLLYCIVMLSGECVRLVGYVKMSSFSESSHQLTLNLGVQRCLYFVVIVTTDFGIYCVASLVDVVDLRR